MGVENDGDNLKVHWNSNTETESTQGQLEGDRYLKVVDTIGTTAGDDGENAYIRNDNVLRAKGGDGDGYAIGCKTYKNDVGYIQFLQDEIKTGKKSKTRYARISFLETSKSTRKLFVRRKAAVKQQFFKKARKAFGKAAKSAKKFLGKAAKAIGLTKAVNYLRNPSGNKLSKNMRRSREREIKALSILSKQCEAFRDNCNNDKDCSLAISG